MARRFISTRVQISAKFILAGAAMVSMSQLPAYSPPPRNAPAKVAQRPSPPPARLKPATPARKRPATPFEISTALPLERGLQHGEYAWEDSGAPPGRLWVHVDLRKQVMRVVQGSSEIGRTVILYGADDKPTPVGQFKVTQKDADHVSNLYNVPMPYMLRLTNDGIAIHASTVEYGVATHGCVGVPEEFAALLFAKAKLGMPVVITNGLA